MRLHPDYQFDTVRQIHPDWLRERGFKALALDLDNTLATYAESAFNAGVAGWLDSIRQAGIPVVVVSNNSEARAGGFCTSLGIPFVHKAGKPKPRGLLTAAARLGVPPERMALVGDQIFTDTLGAHRAGMTAIVVRPLQMNLWHRFRHLLEQPFLRKGRRQSEGR